MKLRRSSLMPRLLSLSVLLLFISPSLQQSSTTIPTCAAPCIASAIANAGCKSGDRQCECYNAATIENFAYTCVLNACTSADQLLTQSASFAICAAYYASLSSTTKATSTAASKASSVVAGASTTAPGASQATAAQNTPGSSSTTTSSSTSPTSGSSSGSSSTTSNGSSSTSKKRKGSLGTGGKAGIGVAAVAIVAILAIALFFFLRRRRRAAPEWTPTHNAMAATESGATKPELAAVEAQMPAYTALHAKREDELKQNTYAVATPIGGQNQGLAAVGTPTHTAPGSPETYRPAPRYQQELSASPAARIVDVAEADSYSVPYRQEVDSYPVPHGSEADSHPVPAAQPAYQPYIPYVAEPSREADSAPLQEKDVIPDIGRSGSQASNSTLVSALSGPTAEGSASGSKLEILETRLDRVRQEKERLSKLQELEEIERELKEEVMAERRKAAD